MARHYSGQRFTADQRLGCIEKLTLFKTNMGSQQIGEPEQDFAIGNLKITHKAMHGAMLNQGAGDKGAATQ